LDSRAAWGVWNRNALRRHHERLASVRAEPDILELGVVFRDLGVKGIGSSTLYQPTLGSVLNPFTIEEIKDPRHPPLKDILVDFEGVNVFCDHRWRNVGLMFVFCAFNVSRISFSR
jgi:hypothetical protein